LKGMADGQRSHQPSSRSSDGTLIRELFVIARDFFLFLSTHRVVLKK
jgi:hypothetical protein